jgi:hypothetical protein
LWLSWLFSLSMSWKPLTDTVKQRKTILFNKSPWCYLPLRSLNWAALSHFFHVLCVLIQCSYLVAWKGFFSIGRARIHLLSSFHDCDLPVPLAWSFSYSTSTMHFVILLTSALKMEAICSSETLANSQNTTLCSYPEDHNLHPHLSENSNPTSTADTHILMWNICVSQLYLMLRPKQRHAASHRPHSPALHSSAALNHKHVNERVNVEHSECW